MQHLGADDELKQVLQQILAAMTPKERLEGLSEEELLEGLTPAQLDRLRLLWQQRHPGESDESSPKSS